MKGKSSLRILLGIGVVAVPLVLVMVSYQVRFTEVAVVETLGRPGDEPVGAGWHVRWPWPVQRVIKYDMRTQHFEGIYEQMQTADERNVLLSVYVCWKVDNPLLFREAVGEELAKGETYVRALIRDAALKAVGKSPQACFAATPMKILALKNERAPKIAALKAAEAELAKLDGDKTPEALRKAGELRLRIKAIEPDAELVLDQKELEDRILELVVDTAKLDYGLLIESVGLKRSSLPEKVSAVVMENMRSEREEKAQQARTSGKAKAQSIVSEADRIARDIMTFAGAKAKEIRAAGEAEAGKYYQLYVQEKGDEEFAMFLHRLEYLTETLKVSSFFILGATDGPIGEDTPHEQSHTWFRKPPTVQTIKRTGTGAADAGSEDASSAGDTPAGPVR